MIVILGALIFAMLAGGLSLLMAIPVLFVWLLIAVYSPLWERATPAPAGGADRTGEDRTDAVAEPARPKTMAAGRSRPLP